VIWRAAQAILLQVFGGASALRQITGLRPLSHPSIFLWDGAWYQWILHFGYAPIPLSTAQPTNFFPFLPWVTRFVQVFVRSEVAAALIVINVSALAAVVLVYMVIREWKGRNIARVAVVAFLLFPTSIFLTQFYTEGLFIALSAGALLALQKGNPWLAGTLAAGTAMTRPPGIFLVVVLVVAHLHKSRKLEWNLAWYGLGFLGIGAVVLAQHVQAHDGLAFLSSPEAWGRKVSLPWTPLGSSIRAYVYGPRPGVAGWSWATIEHVGSPRDVLAAYLFLGLSLVSLFRPWPWAARTLLAVMTLVPLSTGVTIAMNRYVLAAWPGFAVAADLFDRAPRWVRALAIAMLAAGSIAVIHDWSKGFLV
jgi:mannosyltransferase PIG-V